MSPTAEFERLDDLLDHFRVSRKVGFLSPRPSTTLPDEFQPWIEICDSLHSAAPSLLRSRILALPTLSTDCLLSHDDLRLAHLVLATLVSAYLWIDGPDEAPCSLPACLSVPFSSVSDRLGMYPVVSHASVCLANWRKIDEDGTLEPSNMRLIHFHFHDDRGMDWFFVNTAQIEIDFSPCVTLIADACLRVARGEPTHLEPVYSAIQQCLLDAVDTLKKLPLHLSPAFFYHRLRPFLWGYNVGALASTGLRFERGSDTPLRLAGGSAAQSSTVQTVDAFLRVQHTGEEGAFLCEQRGYMPRCHRDFIEYVERNAPIHPSTDEYRAALDALIAFRSTHIQTVAQFILTQQRGRGTGTGGTPFIAFLKQLRHDTKHAMQ